MAIVDEYSVNLLTEQQKHDPEVIFSSLVGEEGQRASLILGACIGRRLANKNASIFACLGSYEA